MLKGSYNLLLGFSKLYREFEDSEGIKGIGGYLESLWCKTKVVDMVQNLIVEGSIQANAINSCIVVSTL